MSKFLSLFIVVFLSTYSFGSFAQSGVSINDNGAAPDPNAILDITSTTKGVLLPRVTSAQRVAISPTASSDLGMMVYDTDTGTYWYWDGGAWEEVPSVSSLSGNTLDEAYDEGGSGSGRVITADAGAVEIQGNGGLLVNGSLGIGTTSPDLPLHTEGEALIDLYGQGDGAGLFFREGFTSTNAYNLGLLLHDDGDGSADALDVSAFDGIYFNTGSNARNPRMVVQSDGRVRIDNLAEPTGAIITSNPSGVLGKTPLTGSATDVLLGTGAFGSASSFEDDDWYVAGTSNTPDNIGDNIYTNGNVGVGVSSPTERLSITGTNTDTFSALGLRSGNDNNGFNNGAQIAFGYNGTNTYQHFIQTRHNSANSQNAVDFYVSDGTQNNTLTSGSIHTMSLVSGNVGVGTTAPAGILHVSTSQVGNVSKLHNSTLSNGSLVGHEFGKANSTNNMAEFRYNHVSDGSSSNWINLGLWGNANTLNVLGSGNVGIGTTSPGHQLSVGVTTSDGQAVSVRGYSNSPASWKGGAAFGYTSASVIMGQLNSVAQLGGHNGTLGAWANLAINSGGGNVGIGTTGPIQTLDVNGRIHVNNGVIQRGGAAITGTSDLGLYSRISGNWMRIVTNNAPIRFFSDDNTGTSINVSIEADGTLEAQKGMRTERQIRFYKRSRGNGQGGVDNLGNYDFCYLAGVAFRNSDSYQDEDDDYQCNVYTQDINGSAEYNEGENEDFTTNFTYSTRPYWRMYSECYQDCSNSTCTAMCINFNY